MPVTLRLIDNLQYPLALSEISPSRCHEIGEQILRQPVLYGNAHVELGQLFTIKVGATLPAVAQELRLVFEGDLSRAVGIAAGLREGSVLVEGNAGMHSGSRMLGGELNIQGDAGDWLGAEMSGGSIRVDGHAGKYVGRAYHGARRGMSGGEILIRGRAGDELGATLRRGLIAVHQGCGELAGYGMIGGTLHIEGVCGRLPGLGMKRGTIWLSQKTEVPALAPTAKYAGLLESAYIGIHFRRLENLKWPTIPPSVVHRYRADGLHQGLGEILKLV